MPGLKIFQSDLTTAKLFAYLIFGIIGLAAFVYGKKNRLIKPFIVGLALMVYPYFISGTLLLYVIGILLAALVFAWRE